MKHLLYCFAAILIASSFFSCTSKSSQKTGTAAKKDIYIQLYSVRNDIGKDFTGTIQKLGNIGFTGIEAASYNSGKFYGLTPTEFKAAIENAGMKVLSSHTGGNLAKNIDETNWQEVWKWWDQAIADHKAAGMKYIVKPSMPVPKTLADLKKYCDYYNQIGEKCNKAGLKFGYHNHAFEFQKIDGQVMYDYMIQNTDPSKVFFQMDVYWVVEGKHDPVAYFNKYPGRFTILHIKDEKELGESGKINFDNIFQNIKNSGMKYIMVEVEKYNHPPLQSVEMSYNYLANNPNVKKSYSK